MLWGWPHCVQDAKLTQLAIDRKLTLIAFEAMNHWTSDGSFGLHVFHKNNELAGYSSVLHALQLVGSTGDYGRRLRAVVIGFGATARGAVTALKAHGVHDVNILTNRGVAAVGSPIHSARMVHFDHDDEDPRRSHAFTDDEGRVPLAGFLARARHHRQLRAAGHRRAADVPHRGRSAGAAAGHAHRRRVLRRGNGLHWARPTTFTEPSFMVGDHVHYYGVDHSPSYLWNSATWEISEALLPHLRTVLTGAWDDSDIIRRAIEIRAGVIENPAILSFQHRSSEYPHAYV